MGTPNSQNKLLVKTPKYSIFDISSDHKLTYEMGRIVPANEGYELMPGDEIDINLQQLTRFMPMLSPVMQRYVLDFIPVFVPYRLLWTEEAPIWNANKFFNPATPDSERPAVPMTSWFQLFSNKHHIVFGSLFDYLGYPTITGLYTAMLNGYVQDGESQEQMSIDALFKYNLSSGHYLYFKYLGSNYSIHLAAGGTAVDADCFTFFGFIQDRYHPADMQAGYWKSYEDMIKDCPGSLKMQDVQDSFLQYVFYTVVGRVYSSVGAKDLSLLPWLCYWRAVLDWFVRTDMVDCDTHMGYLKNITNKLTTTNSTLASLTSYNGYFSSQFISGKPAARLWMDDYFTTAMTSLQSGANVAIPVNGTIQQLWEANRLEQFRMRIQLAGKRYMDQILQLFGVKVPDARLQRTEVLGHLKFNIVVSDVLQTSQSDIDSSLGQFAGQAISTSGSHLLHYKADEPGYLLILASVRPTTSYVDRTPRILLKSDYYDFANPMFDNVGVQAIMNNELCYRPGDTSVFGYSPRRYAEYMTGFSSIHGDFKTSLDYWHAARKFNLDTALPALNQAFIHMDDADSLNRIFASQSGANLLSQIYLDARVTRPLSRYVNYHM